MDKQSALRHPQMPQEYLCAIPFSGVLLLFDDGASAAFVKAHLVIWPWEIQDDFKT